VSTTGARRRTGAPVALTAAALAVAVALGACGGGNGGGGGGGSGHRASRATEATLAPAAPATTTAPNQPARPQPDLRSPALRHLQAAVLRDLRPVGDATGVLVYDMTDHRTLFSLRAGVARPPASVEKLYTTIAAAQLLGSDAELHTAVLGTGHLARGGVWHGNLYLRGDGDPTLGDGGFNRVWLDGYGPTAAQLVVQLREQGIRRVTGRVIADETRFDTDRGGPATGDAPDVPDYGGQLSALVFDHGAASKGLSPATFAARELALTLRGAHIRAFAATRPGRTPRRAHPLAVVASPPLSVLLRLMDVPSDDLIADLLTKQLGFHIAHSGTLAAGAEQIAQVIGALYGLHPRILDGSGLDKADRSTPAQVVALLRYVWHTTAGRVLAASLPVIGVNGTVRTIGLHSAAVDHCIAKTGTLNTVTNLAGYCHARHGHMLVFALFVDDHYNWQALPAISRMVGAIAAY
jgi:D-alanyl-D-alanine carboxypeptidase/D-alanyl-D-alanine-endopeptidase (penicillin-binding protein 4)